MTEEQGVHDANYGHIGEQDSIINMIEGVEQGRLKDGYVMVIVGAGCRLRHMGTVWHENSDLYPDPVALRLTLW